MMKHLKRNGIFAVLIGVLLLFTVGCGQSEKHSSLSKKRNNPQVKFVLTVATVGDVTEDGLNEAKEIIKNRLETRGVKRGNVRVQNGELVVSFDRAKNQSEDEVRRLIEKITDCKTVCFCRGEDNPIDNPESIILQGSQDIASASASLDDYGNYAVQLKLTGEGKTKFSTATAEMVGQQISIWLGDGETAKMYSAPMVNERIDGGIASITGDFDAESAEDLANVINGGSLPFPMYLKDGTLEIN
ncbi:MAG: hypothetical protein MJ132_07730 [Clostridia bacterium]|nr:hypothetical protein [Clostridia bacterium]